MIRPPFAQPVLLPADDPSEPVRFASAEDLAERLHQLRARRRLECSPGRASLEGEPDWPCITIRAVERSSSEAVAPPKADDAGRIILGTVAGPGVDDLDALMAALRVTYPASRSKAAGAQAQSGSAKERP